MATSSGPRYLISIDYGTTFTGVAWVLTVASEPSTLQDVNVAKVWPVKIHPKVPSEFTYSASEGDHERWGFGLDHRSYVLRWTKMELVPPSRQTALESLKKTLEEAKLLGCLNNVLVNQIPLHLMRTAEEIVTEYLTKVAICVRRDIENKRDPTTLQEFPIDLIITHPAEWQPRARNSTFRAAHEAFRAIFSEMDRRPGNIMMTTEPEACAQYTMRVALDQGMTGLRLKECFVVVDAGGGTVDLASYRIDQLVPNFKMTKVTEVSGGFFGATRIDEYFVKRFLPERLSPSDYDALLAIGGNAERHGSGSHVVFTLGEQIMLGRFQRIKEAFAGPPPPGQEAEDDYIDLPEGIGSEDDPERGIEAGRLRLTYTDLVEIFRESVEGTLHLIHEQMVQMEVKRFRAGTIFLSGGFSRNQYLFNQITSLARRWRFNLVRGDESDEGSWTAVIKGAALIGLGVGCEVPQKCVPCPYNIGLLVSTPFKQFEHNQSQLYTDTFTNQTRAKGHIKWVIAKGDLITQQEGIEKSVKIFKKMTRNGNRAGSVTIVTASDRELGEEALRQDLSLDYDLSIIPPQDQPAIMRIVAGPNAATPFHKVEMELTIRLDQQNAHFELTCGKTVDFL
ncbi:hypothetical protein B0H66DRAFT_498128, partial [Apodospora peruviana]